MKSKIKFGFHLFEQSSEFINYNYEDEVLSPNMVLIDEFLSTAFTELDLRISKTFAVNAGIRYESSKLIDKTSISPRFSSAYKVSKNSQFSYAYGEFFQTPDVGFDQWYRRNNIDISEDLSNLEFEQSTHHILNYEWSKKGKTLRFEIFKKKYDNLILSYNTDPNCVEIKEPCIKELTNGGYGFSKGAELFWRLDQTKDGVGKDIWIAYSYLDSKRKFKQYDNEIIPSFASNHKLTFIYKHGVKLKNGSGFNSSLALTATTGYPYYDIFNREQYESDPYLSFDIGGSYLPEIDDGFMVIFFNLSNPLGYRNSFGYNYIDYNGTQLVPGEEKLPSSVRSIFIGCFMFFSIDKSK